MWFPVHVGEMACDSAGAASLRMNVDADPFTAVNPTLAVGFAAAGRLPHTTGLLLPADVITWPAVPKLPPTRTAPDELMDTFTAPPAPSPSVFVPWS